MITFFDELKRAREARKMSISDIAEMTLINPRYLQAIEEGNISILPEAYVRAFIREYAASIGLDSVDVMRRFDAAKTPGIERDHAPAPPEIPRSSPLGSPPVSGGAVLLSRHPAAIAAGAVILVAAVLGVWRLIAPDATPPAKETPFQSVVQENERRVASAQAANAPHKPKPADSLTLFAAATDTVWFTVATDSLPPREYFYRPGAKNTWRAKERFTLTLGNGGALQFTLNQKKIGALGRRGSVLRNIPITRQNLTPP